MSPLDAPAAPPSRWPRLPSWYLSRLAGGGCADALPEHVLDPGDVDGDRRSRVGAAEVPAPRGRVEREPAVAVEPDLDPGVRVPVVDAPRSAVHVVGAAREAGGDAGGNPEVAQHQSHRAGEVLAVAALRAGDERDERRHAAHLRRMFVVAEASARPQPGLDRHRRRVRIRRRSARDVLGRPVDRKVRPQARVVERVAEPDQSLLRPERRDQLSRPDLEVRPVGVDLARVPSRRLRELRGRGLWLERPRVVLGSTRQRLRDLRHAAPVVRNAVQRVACVRDRPARADHVAVPERVDVHGRPESTSWRHGRVFGSSGSSVRRSRDPSRGLNASVGSSSSLHALSTKVSSVVARQ